ncbi:pantoate--beta-alanine ligase [Cryptosporangium arvum]|uniref:Pantothenate synthetase n=1 Tax=Cryptosporangium arvum DSM 44712 TaxID=927661 RepID=A0A010YW67_9ACTN|nr:pantoate--beta-alanine ligase [Cryptosporangium arvum]EXG79388.1 pantothenate synthetase [Cryptosporangium arvum DSM 44712]
MSAVRVPIVVHDREALARERERADGPVAVVMTMGALHEGHAALLRQARARAATVITTIFVNPLQFGPNEDFDRYPRTLATDLELCAREDVDVVFAPSAAVMYPDGQPRTRVNPGPLGEILEGASRPGFFHGVLTVVLKLINLTRPDVVFFGEKDYQQVALVRQMVRDLDLDIEVVGVPTVREPDGLALSSRNRYLSGPERTTALALAAALRAGAAAGEGGAAAVEAAANAVLGDASGLQLDYAVVTAPDLGPAPESGEARLILAAKVGTTRLIDNGPVRLASRTGLPPFTGA